MFDEFLLNTKFARWIASKYLRKSIKKKYGIDGVITLKKLVVRSDEKTAFVDVALSFMADRKDVEKIVNDLFDE